jgi:hypothetical protein
MIFSFKSPYFLKLIDYNGGKRKNGTIYGKSEILMTIIEKVPWCCVE